ncbi:hypothetical protein GGR42_003078 [Saonia flava]|uniref:DUF192 domain-containing protein n=1 Tax=Saonia flava TaxID=523696 RepID=A0A846QZG2_9FLAO|nr:DUF192 domain-containing protein [Saonia flava]NJB72587.1 hypothetical protein [Saonia flava]
MKTRLYLFLFIIGILIQASCKDDAKKVIKTEPISFKKEGELTIYKAKTDSVLTKLDIEIADSEYETQTGLMYRDSMEDDQGMLFIFPEEAMHSFYMKNTKIALDIVFIGSDLKIDSFQEGAKPMDETGLSSQVPVQYVLEINAGLAEKWLLEVGDSIVYSKK